MSAQNFFQDRIENTFSPMDYMQVSKANPDQFLMVDVRNAPPHLKKEKIAGAIEIPLSELEQRVNELPKGKTIVVYCWDSWCNMAAHSALVLLQNGYAVKELSGGIAAWKTVNLPVQALV
jgi:rhodanese-related sulfurtransferase